MGDWGELLRFMLGWSAILLAGVQVTMRYVLASYMPHAVSVKERSGSIATGLLLLGVGLGNITHLTAPATVSTVILAAAVVASVWACYELWVTAQVVANGGDGNHPIRRGDSTND